MRATKRLIEEFAAALGVDSDVTAAPPIAEWEDVRTKTNSDKKGHFLDFGMGGGRSDAVFSTAPRGPLRMEGEGGGAIGFYKIRVAEDRTWRLEVHSMGVDWHLGLDGCDARNIQDRIRLAHRMAGAALPAGWTKGKNKTINREDFRSSMAWHWADWSTFEGLDALVVRVTQDVEAIRPILVRAVAER